MSWFTDWSFLGNSAERWTIAIAIFIVSLLLMRVLRGAMLRRVERASAKTDTAVDDLIAQMLGHTHTIFLLVVAIWAAAFALDLGAGGQMWMGRLLFLALLLQGAAWGNHALMFTVNTLRSKEDLGGARRTTLAAVTFLGRLTIFSLILLLGLANFGIDVTALVASLGIASLAVALALQGLLTDLLASLSIVVDKPFEIGDFIIVEDFLGTVEHVGLRTTRLRSLSGEQLVFTNDDLLGSRIRNFKRMQERRVVFDFGVVYETPRERLADIPRMVREIIESLEETRFDRSHFKAFGAYSLDFETVFYVLTPDYNRYMDIQEQVNLQIVDRFREADIEFAFPSKSVFLHARSGFDGWTGGTERERQEA